jgi:hypothetical protein
MACWCDRNAGANVEQLNNFADSRLLVGCTYCGGPEETRDHVPSRVLLDEPYPDNLPVVPCCWSCNNELARDEEYLACLIEAVVVGSTDPDCFRRARVADILRRSPGLRTRIESARRTDQEQTLFDIEGTRVRNVILKLARGHAAYELSSPCREEPTAVRWWPLYLMSEEDRSSYEASEVLGLFGEVGSRRMQRLLVTQLTPTSATGEISSAGVVVNDWVEVQEARYRYLATDLGDEVRIKIVIGDYLACDISWDDDDR